MRFGACLMIMSLLVGLVMPPRKARAVVAVDDIAVVAGAFLGACGLKWILKDVDASGFTGAVHDQINNYLDTELGGISVKDWVGGALIAATTDGGISISGTLARKLSAWANWMVARDSIENGQTVTLQKAGKVFQLNGQNVRFSTASQVGDSNNYGVLFSDLGSVWSTTTLPLTFEFPSGYKLVVNEVDGQPNYVQFIFYTSSGAEKLQTPYVSKKEYSAFSFAVLDGYFRLVNKYAYDDKPGYWGFVTGSYSQYRVRVSDLALDLQDVGEISLGATALDVPKTDEIEDDDVLILNPSLELAAGASLDDMLQEILNAILAGNLTVTKTITEEQNPDVPGEVTDVDELGLPALGEALVSRFPFSIPWDVAKGIKLVAAPAKAPYWELDFLAPIAGRVGGWKGSTKVVIDMGEYPIIGQACRWASTIGFCLLLAAGTKKLIWTA